MGPMQNRLVQGQQNLELKRLTGILAVGICFTVFVAMLLNRSGRGIRTSSAHPQTVASPETQLAAATAPVALSSVEFRSAEAIRPAPNRAQAKAPRGDRYGMEAAGLQLIAEGALLHFRYKIVDPLKAGEVGLEGGSAYIVDSKGRKFSARTVPATGSSFAARHLNKAGSAHSTFFPNRGGFRKGDLVTVVIGKFRADNVKIE